jgi:beta-exotoxin I transport system permease protein
MQRPSIFLKTLRDLRWQVFWYGLGMALMAALVVYIYPSYKDQFANFDIPEAMRALIGNVDYGTGPGFISAEFFSWIPIVVVVFAITSGTGALGSEEANGTLDLLLAQPVSRTRLAVEKLAGLLLSTLLIAAITFLGWLASIPFVTIDVSLGDLAVATLNLVPLIVLLQSLACLASVTLSTRGAATGAITAFAVASYFVNYIASLVDAIDPLRYVSVFYYYHGTDVLTDGLDWGGLALLLGLFAACSLLSVLAFQRREVGAAQTNFSLPWLRRLPTEAAS